LEISTKSDFVKGVKCNMKNTKQEVIDLIAQLPDDCTLEDIQYHIYVKQKIVSGLQDIEKGDAYTQEEVEERLSKWLIE